MFLGIDIGSSSSKVAILDESQKIVITKVVNMGTGTNGIEEALQAAFTDADLTPEDIKFTVATGYGRLKYEGADKQITEITCHARGVKFLMESVDTIIDIGGQDAKVIRLTAAGQVENFVMNEKCAAGTGRFLEVMARVLDTRLENLAELADQSTKEVPISSVCTVFAESEVISSLAAGESRADVARGANMAIAKRVAGMAKRVGIGNNIVMTGGVALNRNMVQAMGEVLERNITAVPDCQAVGAIGAAVLASETYYKKKKNSNLLFQ